jgi:O-antigen/teichoic acid export membrane protein
VGIVVRQSLKAGLGSYIGVGIGVINQMYISTKFLSVEQLSLSRLLLENSILFSAFAHLGTPFIADKFFGLFRSDEEGHRGILPFLLALPFIGGLLFTAFYLFFTPAIHAYYAKESPMLLQYHILVVPYTFFWIYITVLESYCRNNARIAVPSFVREVYLKLANVLLILVFAFGWISFDMMLYLIIASYGVGVLILIGYIKTLGKWYWRFPDRSVLTPSLIRQMLAYGGFTLLGGIGSNLMLFIDRSMLAGEAGLVSAGIFIIASYLANIIDIPRKAIGQISIPLLSASLLKGDHGHVRLLNQKSALNQLIAGGLFFVLIWASIDDIFFLIPKGETYGEGKYVVLFLATVKVLDMATGLNNEIILYSKYFKWATLFLVASAVLTLLLNFWLIPLYGYTGAAIAAVLTTLAYSSTRMFFVWSRFNVLPFTRQTLYVLMILIVLYAGTFALPQYHRTTFSSMLMIAVRSGLIVLFFAFAVIRLNVSEEITGLYLNLRRRILK